MNLRTEVGNLLKRAGEHLAPTPEPSAEFIAAEWASIATALSGASNALDQARGKISKLKPRDEALSRDVSLLAAQVLDLRGQLETLRIRARPPVPATPPSKLKNGPNGKEKKTKENPEAAAGGEATDERSGSGA